MASLNVAESTVRQRKRLPTVIAIAGVAVAVVAYWAWDTGSQHRALLKLPQQERRALYERTLRTLESSCDPKARPDGLEGYCRDQANFAAQFPECDAACSALVKRNEAMPAR